VKGIINRGIQELVECKFCKTTWEKIKKRAGCNDPFISASEDYPDQTTYDLVDAASEITELPHDTVLMEFGKYWIPNTGARSYPTFFKLAGDSARVFLLNMAIVHRHIAMNRHNFGPPIFEYEETPSGRLLMYYKSPRMLCSALHGLILCVGIYFGEKLEVEETSCMKTGDPCCTMKVAFS